MGWQIISLASESARKVDGLCLRSACLGSFPFGVFRPVGSSRSTLQAPKLCHNRLLSHTWVRQINLYFLRAPDNTARLSWKFQVHKELDSHWAPARGLYDFCLRFSPCNTFHFLRVYLTICAMQISYRPLRGLTVVYMEYSYIRGSPEV